MFHKAAAKRHHLRIPLSQRESMVSQREKSMNIQSVERSSLLELVREPLRASTLGYAPLLQVKVFLSTYVISMSYVIYY